MAFFLWFIWFGGAVSMPNKKIGFMNRVLWLYELGERLGEFALKGKGE